MPGAPSGDMWRPPGDGAFASAAALPLRAASLWTASLRPALPGCGRLAVLSLGPTPRTWSIGKQGISLTSKSCLHPAVSVETKAFNQAKYQN